MMRVYIQGVCGTFMAGVAVLAQQLGFDVYGSDKSMYPPMDKQLKNIKVDKGYDVSMLNDNGYPDHVVIGNSMSRKIYQVEEVLNNNISFSSGPEWVAKNVLDKRKVLAIAGTHGKTSTASMLLWILRYAGLDPGYLIGGVPKFVETSANLGTSDWFIIEADEYDSAFFDKRAKCLHIKPFAAVVNNLEHDHFDIYDSLKDIEKVFLQWVKLIPLSGGLVCSGEKNCEKIVKLAKDITNVNVLNQNEKMIVNDLKNNEAFWVLNDEVVGKFCAEWVSGHMLQNALSASAIAYYYVGIDRPVILEALTKYPGVARRMELKKKEGGVFWYDDFAHHPTAIKKTIEAARLKHPHLDVFVCLDLSSYSLKQNKHLEKLKNSLVDASKVLMLKTSGDDDLAHQIESLVSSLFNVEVFENSSELIKYLEKNLNNEGVVLTISSKEFKGVRV